jgi:hypothetical protein
MMVLRGSPLLIVLLLAAGPAAAQTFQPSQGFQPMTPQAPPAQQMPPCFKEFSALRGEADKYGKALQAAGQRKAPPQEACKLLTSLVAAEKKLLKYTEENGTWCGIPPQILAQMKDQQGKTSTLRTRVCDFAARGSRAAPGPTLSDALGTNLVPNSSNVQSGRGTFDTLTGSPLGK